MSTRCQIAFYRFETNYTLTDKNLTNFDALIYRHWDGYPSAVLKDIVPPLKAFSEKRGLDDIEYSAAYLVSKLKTDFLNIGISKRLHSDIEFLYAIFPNGKIDIYATNFWDDTYTDFEKIDSIDIATWQSIPPKTLQS